MMNRITKNTIMIVIFVTVCVASFVAVRQLTRNEQINNPVINVNNSVAMPTESTTESTTAPTTAKPTTTAPTTTLPAVTTTLPTTTKPVPSTTIVAPTTAPTTTKKPTTTAAPATTDPYIQQAAQQSQGFLGYMFNDDGNFYYTASDPWQRNFGFNKMYDFGAQFVFMFYDSARIFFDYGEKNWMVEFWKGQYGGVFIGAEIGVYTRSSSLPLDFYECADEEHMLNMSMSVLHGKDTIIIRPYEKYWWCTGFVPGILPSAIVGFVSGGIDTSPLTMYGRITMFDEVMRDAFCGALEENGFVYGKDYFYSGLDVIFTWN